MSRYNEYGLGPLPGVVSMTKVKNAIKRSHSNVIPHLRNVRINGQLQGCSGFIEDPATGRIVYISTDVNHGSATQALYRNAEHLRDYSGKRNRYCALDAQVIVDAVTDLLESKDLS